MRHKSHCRWGADVSSFGPANENRDVRRIRGTGAVLILLIVFAVLSGSGCHRLIMKRNVPGPVRDINTVLAEHDSELLAIPGVVGVYIGLLPDDKTPCLKVMAARITTELQRRIPKALEGHLVMIEETGIIQPLGSH